MSGQDLKLGDVCVLVAPVDAKLVGIECVITGEEREYSKKIADQPLMEVWVFVFGFAVQLVDGRKMAVERRCLRKKGNDDQDFVPATEDFQKDLQRLLKKPAHAGAELIFAGVATEPVVSSYVGEAVMMAFVIVGLLSWLAVMVWQYVKARRADRQLEAEMRMRAGWRTLKRRGWLPEDLQ